MSQPSAASSQVIGVDLDNTLAIYDELFHTVALERGLISSGVPHNKTEVRDVVRRLPGGEIEWRKLQGSIYGPRMAEAKLSDGAGSFFQSCRQRGVKVFIVSHKTELGHFDETHTNLRESAMNWMDRNEFFAAIGLAISAEDVFFEDTRLDKLERIKRLGCTHFIDDLEEVLLDPGFPPAIRKILYAPHRPHTLPPELTVAGNWDEVTECVFAIERLAAGD